MAAATDIKLLKTFSTHPEIIRDKHNRMMLVQYYAALIVAMTLQNFQSVSQEKNKA
ncbi:MAG: hypothetical protein U0T77_10055 [Chitinophagales bacterium]